MGKDIARGESFPLFMYGQRYMLALGSWLCAPLFLLFGAGPVTLKLPMLLFNIAFVALLWWELRRDAAVAGPGAFFAALPFALPGVVTASRIVEHQGGNVEPFLFVLLGYVARQRALWLGLIFGIGALNREFALIGLIALMLVDVVQGRMGQRWRFYAVVIGTVLGVSALVRFVASLSPDYYGITAKLSFRGLTRRDGLLGYALLQLPTLLGTRPLALRDYNITSSLSTGHTWVFIVFLSWAVLACALRLRDVKRSELDGLPVYLMLVGVGQALAYIIMCPAPRDVMLVRYALLSLLGVIGLVAFAWSDARLRLPTVAAVICLCLPNALDHVRLAREYLSSPPKHENELLAAELTKLGVRYGVAEYWIAYDVAWLTDEATILSPRRKQADRMRRYRETVIDHWPEAVEVRSDECVGGTKVYRWSLCKPEQPL